MQEVGGFEGNIETAKSDKESWLDRAAWSQRMVKRGFYSLSQADADQSRLQSMEIAFRKAQGDLDIYRIFDCEKNVTKTWSDVKEAQRNLTRKEFEAEANLKKKRADETAKKSIYDQEVDRLRDMERDEKFYVMTAPQDGLVVYFVSEQTKGFSGAQQSTVAQGEPVRESQKLMRIPNLHKMLVNTRVHEAMISKVKGEVIKPTGYGEALRLRLLLRPHRYPRPGVLLPRLRGNARSIQGQGAKRRLHGPRRQDSRRCLSRQAIPGHVKDRGHRGVAGRFPFLRRESLSNDGHH